ncbi:MAG: type II toxin-antitoxin system RelE/ParE family toxin [Clostridiales bacterium]|nr:type II toxin-antitoxin system RelE/ParE family toxin [Clostridiales bacterium]
MEIIYKTTKLEKECTNYSKAKRKYNQQVADKLYSTINFIENASNLLDVKNMPMFRLHALKGDRKGTYAIDLGKKLGYRLIITPLDDEKNEWNTDDEYLIFKSTKVIIILEVTNHYE